MCSRGTVRIKTTVISQRYGGLLMTDKAIEWKHPHPESGEIRPNETLPAITWPAQGFSELDIMTWGMFSDYGTKLMRNARAETVDQLPTWRGHFGARRIIVPF